MSFDANKYMSEYKKDNYEQVMFRVYKGRKQTLKDAADARNLPVSKFITDALEKQYGLDLSKPKDD